jgi:hypothetical protein
MRVDAMLTFPLSHFLTFSLSLSLSFSLFFGSKDSALFDKKFTATDLDLTFTKYKVMII